MGYEAFMNEAQAEVIDSDVDPGGKRQLLRVTMARDEDLVCLSVLCPSTARQYIIRVPPRCSHAIRRRRGLRASTILPTITR